MIEGGELVGAQALPSWLNPARFDASKFAAMPESRERRRKAALARQFERDRRCATQIGASMNLVLNSRVPTRGIALGAAAWAGGVYAYAPDYVLNAGDPVTANLTPRVGAGVLTPTNSSGSSANNPLYNVNAIGGRPCFDMSLNNACFNLHWLAPSYQGNDVPCSVIFRGQRTQNESGCAFGMGTSSATLRFMELQHVSAGTSQVQRNDATTTATAGPTTQNEAFTSIVVGMSFDGTQCSIYHNGVLTSVSAAALNVGSISSLTQARWGSTGRGAAGTDDYAGYMQFLGVSPLVLSAAQHLQVNDFLVAQDVPPSVGTPFMWAGDSIMRASGSGGLRKYFYEWYVAPAQDYALDAQGPVETGSFPDNQCNAFSGLTTAQLTTNLAAILGTGKAYPGIVALVLWVGSNDCVSGYDGPTFSAQYAALLASCNTLLRSTVPTARMVVMNITPKDGANNAFVLDANARLFDPGGICDTWDAANPTATIAARVDAFNAIGGVWNATYFLDAVHPNYVGYGLIANDPTYGFIATAGPYFGTIG